MKKLLSVLFICSFVLVGCSGSDNSKDEATKDDKVIKIGATAAPHAEILEALKDEFEEEGYTLEVTVFDDYVLPNTAVNDGELDANFFQHEPYLLDFNKENGTKVNAVGTVHFEPLGIYSKDATKADDNFSVDDVKEGAVIAVPDDQTNGARALLLLEAKGIIKVEEGKGLDATKADIIDNPKNVEILETKADGIPSTLPDVDYAVINGNYALTNKVDDKFIVGETSDSEGAKTYANVIAVKEGNEDSKKIKVLVKVLNSEDARKFIEETYGKLVVPTF